MTRCVLILLLGALLPSAHVSAVDPMRPAFLDGAPKTKTTTKKKQPAQFTLQQIRISDSDTSAVVNGQLVREGSWLLGAKVVEIKDKRVILNHKGKRKELSLTNAIKESLQ